MFYGDGGAGKTTLTVDLSCHLAAGDDWLGIPIGNAVRVGIVENEGPRPLRKVARKLAAWKGSDLGDRLHLLEEPWGKVSLDNPDVRAALGAKIAEHELDVVVIGPITRSGMNEAGTLQQVRDYIAPARPGAGRRWPPRDVRARPPREFGAGSRPVPGRARSTRSSKRADAGARADAPVRPEGPLVAEAPQAEAPARLGGR
jgi:hypothetical protein